MSNLAKYQFHILNGLGDLDDVSFFWRGTAQRQIQSQEFCLKYRGLEYSDPKTMFLIWWVDVE